MSLAHPHRYSLSFRKNQHVPGDGEPIHIDLALDDQPLLLRGAPVGRDRPHTSPTTAAGAADTDRTRISLAIGCALLVTVIAHSLSAHGG